MFVLAYLPILGLCVLLGIFHAPVSTLFREYTRTLDVPQTQTTIEAVFDSVQEMDPASALRLVAPPAPQLEPHFVKLVQDILPGDTTRLGALLMAVYVFMAVYWIAYMLRADPGDSDEHSWDSEYMPIFFDATEYSPSHVATDPFYSKLCEKLEDVKDTTSDDVNNGKESLKVEFPAAQGLQVPLAADQTDFSVSYVSETPTKSRARTETVRAPQDRHERSPEGLVASAQGPEQQLRLTLFRGGRDVPTPGVVAASTPGPNTAYLTAPSPGIWPPCTPVRLSAPASASAKAACPLWPPAAPSPSALPKLYPSNPTVSDTILAASVPSGEDLVKRRKEDGGPPILEKAAAAPPAAAVASASLGWRARNDTNYSPSNWRFRGRPRLGDPGKRMLMHFLSAETPTVVDANDEVATPAADPGSMRSEENDNTLVHQIAQSAQPKEPESTRGEFLSDSGDTVIQVTISAARSPIWKGVRRFRAPSHSLEEDAVADSSRV